MDEQREFAGDILESFIDAHLRSHAMELQKPGEIAFPLAANTDADVLKDVIGRFESVGWAVTRRDGSGGSALVFKPAK